MKFLPLLAAALLLLPVAKAAKSKTCDCKCVTKDDEGNYTTVEASGKTRAEAGEKLKKLMKKKTCELTPVCKGACGDDSST